MGNATKFRTSSSCPPWPDERGRALLGVIAAVTLAHVSILYPLWSESSSYRTQIAEQANPVVEATVLPVLTQTIAPPLAQKTQTHSSPKPATATSSPTLSGDAGAEAAQAQEQSFSTSLSATDPSLSPLPEAASSDLADAPVQQNSPAPQSGQLSAERGAESPAQPVASTPEEAPVIPAYPTVTRLEYEVTGASKGLRYNAQATMDWRFDSNQYSIEMTLRAFLLGKRTQRSEGQVTSSGLQPSSFVDKARRERRLLFDWPQGVAKAEGPSVPIPTGTQDRLSTFFQLASLLASHKNQMPLTLGMQWDIPVMGWSGVEMWTFRAQGTSEIELPFGRLDAVQVSRILRAGNKDDQSVDVWYAPSLNFMPVRIRITQENGDIVDQRLSGM